MPTATPIILNFNAGELSPLIYGRVDAERYFAGCRQMENFLPLPQGPATRRPGTYFVAPSGSQSSRSALASFIFNRTETFVLEFFENKLRFFANDGQVTKEGQPYEIETPWSSGELFDDDGVFLLSLAQVGDLVWIASKSVQTQILTRRDTDDWSLAPFEPDDGPFLPENLSDITIRSTVQVGNGSLFASGPIFEPGHVGGLVRLFEDSPDIVRPWQSGKSLPQSVQRRHDGRIYQAVSDVPDQQTGASPPTHDRGTAYDDSQDGQGIEWQYLHSGFGVARITGFVSASEVQITVLSRIPTTVIQVGTETRRWQFGAWSTANGWPTAVTFHRNRLVFGGERFVWFSRTDDYYSYQDRNTALEVLDDDAISVEIVVDKPVNLRWLAELRSSLVVGADVAELIIQPLTTTDPFGPANIQVNQSTDYGASSVQPVRIVDGRVLMVQGTRQALIELSYSLERDGLAGRDLSVFAEHIARAGIVGMAWQARPDGILWLVLQDGSLVGLTMQIEQQVIAWHRHPMAGEVESVAVIPKTSSDEVWISIRRTIDGVERRWIERMAQRLQPQDAFAGAHYVDAGLALNANEPVTVLSGLDHLTNEEVAIFADGAVLKKQIVDGGSLVLDVPARHVHVGLSYTSLIETMPLEAGGLPGRTAQGAMMRVRALTMRLLAAMSVLVGRSRDQLERVVKRLPSTPMDGPEPPVTGVARLDVFPGDYSRDTTITVAIEEPTPATIIAMMPELETST